jgi:hypothetical protein
MKGNKKQRGRGDKRLKHKKGDVGRTKRKKAKTNISNK